MDKFVSMLKEREENLLKKLTDDEKQKYLEDSISVVSIENFRKNNIEQEADKDNRRDHSMILFQFQFGNKGYKIGQFLQAVVISEIAEIIKNKNGLLTNQQIQEIYQEVEMVLIQADKEKKVFFLDIFCKEILKQSKILKNLSNITSFEGIFKPKIQNEEKIARKTEVLACLTEWKCYQGAHPDSMEFQVLDYNVVNANHPFILVKNYPWLVNNIKCFFIESQMNQVKQLEVITNLQPSSSINGHADNDNNSKVQETSDNKLNNPQEKAPDKKQRRYNTSQNNSELVQQANEEQKLLLSPCILNANSDDKANTQMEFKAQEKVCSSQEQNEQLFQQGIESTINNNNSCMLCHTEQVNNHVSNIQLQENSQQHNSFSTKEQNINDQASASGQKNSDIQNISQDFEKKQEQFNLINNEQIINSFNNHVEVIQILTLNEEGKQDQDEDFQDNHQKQTYELLQTTSNNENNNSQEEGKLEKNYFSPLKNENEKKNQENNDSLQYDCSSCTEPAISNQSSPKQETNNNTLQDECSDIQSEPVQNSQNDNPVTEKQEESGNNNHQGHQESEEIYKSENEHKGLQSNENVGKEIDQFACRDEQNQHVDFSNQDQQWNQEQSNGQYGESNLKEIKYLPQKNQFSSVKAEERGTQNKVEEEKQAVEENKEELYQFSEQIQKGDQPKDVQQTEIVQEQTKNQPIRNGGEGNQEKDGNINEGYYVKEVKNTDEQLINEQESKIQKGDSEEDQKKRVVLEEIIQEKEKEILRLSEEQNKRMILEQKIQEKDKEILLLSEEQQKKIIGLEEIIQERKKEILSLSEELQDQKKQVEDKVIEINTLNTQIKENSNSHNSIVGLLAKKTSEFDEINVKKEELLRELTTLRDTQEKAANILALFKAKNCISTDLETTILELRRETDELKGKLNESDITVGKQSNQINELIKVIQEKESSNLAESERFKQELLQKDDEYQRIIVEIKEKLQNKFNIKENELLQSIQGLEKNIKDLNENHEENNKVLREQQIEQRKKDKQQQQEQLRQKDIETLKTKEELEEKISALKTQDEGIIRDLNQQIEQLKKDVWNQQEQNRKNKKEAEETEVRLKQEMAEQQSYTECTIRDLNYKYFLQQEDQKNRFEAKTKYDEIEHQKLIQEQQTKLTEEKNDLECQMQATIDDHIDRINYSDIKLHKDFDSLSLQYQTANEYIAKITDELKSLQITSEDKIAQLQQETQEKLEQIINIKAINETSLNNELQEQTSKIINLTVKINKYEFDTNEAVVAPFRNQIKTCSECNQPVPSIGNFDGKDCCLDCYNEYLSELY